MPTPPEEIIELTDVIEEGHGAASGGTPPAAEQGVDMSFEKELEELFSDSPADATSAASPSPGDDLGDLDFGASSDDFTQDSLDKAFDLPEETELGAPAKDSDGIDFDALEELANATPPAAKPAPAASSAASGLDAQAASELGEKLASLDERLSGLEQTVSGLAATTELEQLRENISQDFSQNLENRLAELPQPEAPADPEALKSDLLSEKLSELAANFDAAKHESTSAVEALRQEIANAAPSQDPEALLEQIRGELEDKLSPLAADLEASRQETSALKESLASLKDEILSDVAALMPVPEAPASEAASLSDDRLDALTRLLEEMRQENASAKQAQEETLAALAAELESANSGSASALAALREEIGKTSADSQKLFDEFRQLIDGRLANLENEIEKKADASAIDALGEKIRTDLTSQLDKTVAKTAAQIIREEISALATALLE